MKVKCIDNEFLEHSLTIDKIYPVLEEKEHYYVIFDNDNEKHYYKKIRFVQVDENKCINMRIRCINNYSTEKYLSKDKIYTVLEEKGDYYVIYDDSKKVNKWNKNRFVPVKEGNMKVKCVNNENVEYYLTANKIYPVEEDETTYTITNDAREKYGDLKCRFAPVEENDIVDIAKEIGELAEKKEEDYNNSFSKTLHKYGNVTYFIKVDYKLNRLKYMLLDNKDVEPNENVEDTLKDIIRYSLLMLKEIKK